MRHWIIYLIYSIVLEPYWFFSRFYRILTKLLVALENFERRFGLLYPFDRKNDCFPGLGGTGGETSLSEYFTVLLSYTGFWETGVDRCDSSCLLDDCETQLMSSRTRVDDRFLTFSIMMLFRFVFNALLDFVEQRRNAEAFPLLNGCM